MLPPELDQKFRSVDYTQYFPMGSAAKFGNYGIKAARAALNPNTLRAGARAFEADALAFKKQQILMAQQARAAMRQLALKAQQKAQFNKIWPQGASDQLIRTGTYNPLRKAKRFSVMNLFK